MEIIVEKDYESLSKKAAEIIVEFVKENPRCVLGLATGSTPMGAYKLLVEKFRNKEISFKNVTTFNLDDYVGLGPENKFSYHYLMKDVLFSKIDIAIENTFFPNDFAPNFENYDKKIEKCGGIDLQILGIGRNGHIGFNEPRSDFLSKSREVRLSETTIEDNSRFFENVENVPRAAATMGMATIMKAKKIILLANGENKKEIIKKALQDPVTPEVPASILQQHKNVTVILDKVAAADLKIKGL